MQMFLWSVGSFYVFGEQVDATCVLGFRVQFVEKHTDLEFIGQMQSSIMSNVPKGFYISEEGFHIFEKGVYMFGKGAHLSEERQIVQIIQIRCLDNVNHADQVTR